MSGGPTVSGSTLNTSSAGFYYSGGTLTDVGWLPHNAPDATGYVSTAMAVNDNGIATGQSRTDDEPAFATQAAHAFMYTPASGGNPASLVDIQGNSAVWKTTIGVAINNNSQIVGSGSLLTALNGTTNAYFAYSGGTMTNMGFPAAGVTFMTVAGLSDSGLVGVTANSNTYLYNITAGTWNTGLNSLFGWTSSSVNAVSHNGLIVGSASVPITAATANSPAVPVAGTWGFIYDSNTGDVTYIDTVTPTAFTSGTNSITSSSIWGVNDEGEAVGKMLQAGTSGSVPMVFMNGIAYPLNSLIDPSLTISTNNSVDQFGVNDSGVIAAAATSPNFLGTQAVVLTPVPEPASLSLLVVGALALGRRRRNILA